MFSDKHQRDSSQAEQTVQAIFLSPGHISPLMDRKPKLQEVKALWKATHTLLSDGMSANPGQP